MNLLTPFDSPSRIGKIIIPFAWVFLIIGIWIFYELKDGTHLFPTIPQVLNGFNDLWNQGLVIHVFKSLWLCLRAVLLSVAISLAFMYTAPLMLLKPISTFISKLRYLPLTGLAFYITMLVDSAREIQIWILVIFMTTYLVTSLLSVLKDIKEDEFNHARTLGCSRWEVLYEVVIKGRADYVLESIRQNFAMIWFCLVTVESIMAAGGGIGFLIKNSDKFMNHGRIIALQLVILFIGISIDFILSKSRKLIFRYSKI